MNNSFSSVGKPKPFKIPILILHFTFDTYVKRVSQLNLFSIIINVFRLGVSTEIILEIHAKLSWTLAESKGIIMEVTYLWLVLVFLVSKFVVRCRITDNNSFLVRSNTVLFMGKAKGILAEANRR